jgi:hypothetical protein
MPYTAALPFAVAQIHSRDVMDCVHATLALCLTCHQAVTYIAVEYYPHTRLVLSWSCVNWIICDMDDIELCTREGGSSQGMVCVVPMNLLYFCSMHCCCAAHAGGWRQEHVIYHAG